MWEVVLEKETLAIELLHEIKKSAHRWFVAFLVMVGLEIVTVVGFIWYITLPVDEVQTTVEQRADDRGFNVIGGDYIGGVSTDHNSP